MDDLTQTLEPFFQKYCAGRRVWVAFSGGLDSLVLLSVAKNLHSSVVALHVNHGVHPDAGLWETRCRQMAGQLGVECVAETLSFQAVPSCDPENLLRNARYDSFAHHLESGDVLLTAHHRDDQAETVLLQLVRGAGPRGLAAMAPVRPFGRGFHGRPLLGVTREAILLHAEKYSLSWLEDPSNTDTRFARNFLRHRVLPVLKGRWKNLSATLARTADNCADQEELLQELLEAEIQKCHGSVPGTLSVRALRERSEKMQAAIVRAWIKALPSRKKLQHILQDVVQAKLDSSPCVCVGEWQIRRYRDDLYCQRPLSLHDASRVFEWDMAAPLVIPGIGKLMPLVPARPCTVRFRSPGGTMPGGVPSPTGKLKKKFQENAIPPWMRSRVPLVCTEDGEVILARVVFDSDS